MGIKKSLKDISWQVSEEEYRADHVYSYSTIARFNREGFKGLVNLFSEQDSPALTFGSIVDCLLTEGEEEFNKKYAVVEEINTSSTINNIVFSLFTDLRVMYPSFVNISDEKILEYINKFNYYPNWKNETRIKSLRDKGSDYYNLLVSTRGKEIISQEEYQDALKCVNALKETRIFDENPFDEDIELLYQIKFKGEYENMSLKCMMDFVVVDHKQKLIIPYDIKTSSSPEYDFPKSFIKWNYYIQAQLYTYILLQNINNDDYFKDFTIFNYQFLVVNRFNLCPLIWEYEDSRADGDIEYGNYKIKSWKEILKELNYYLNINARVPIGISEKYANSITNYLRRNE